MNNGIMGVKEVSSYLNIQEQTVYRLLQNGKLPAIKIGGQWKVKRQHIDKMFEELLNDKLKALDP